jgi:hypothetical protein
LQRASPGTKTPLSLDFEPVRDLGERRERSSTLPKVEGGGRGGGPRRWRASQGRLGVEIEELAAHPRSCRVRHQAAPVAQEQAGPGPGRAARELR